MIDGDTSGLEKSLSAVNNSIKKTQSQLRDVNNLLKLNPSNTILLAQKQELLQLAIGDTEKKLEALEQAQEDVAKAFERGDLGSRLVTAIRNGTASSDQLKTAVEKIAKAVTGGNADIKQLADALDTVDDGQAVRNLINDLNDVGDAAQGAEDDIR